MSYSTHISAGSSTLVKSGPGTVYGAHITPVNGATVIVADTLNAGAGGFDFNTSPTGTIVRAKYADADPDFLDLKGTRFNDGLTVAASSNAPVTVIHD